MTLKAMMSDGHRRQTHEDGHLRRSAGVVAVPGRAPTYIGTAIGVNAAPAFSASLNASWPLSLAPVTALQRSRQLTPGQRRGEQDEDAAGDLRW